MASHSDTTATGAETETLTDGSNASALHVHTVVSLDTDTTGAELTALADGSETALHSHAASGGDFTWLAGDTTEATSTSTTDVDLQTASGFSVDAAGILKIYALYRGIAGGAQRARFRIKLNTTIISAGSSFCSSSDANEDVLLEFSCGPRVTNYLHGHVIIHGSTAQDGNLFALGTANMPTVAVTQVILGGKVDSGGRSFGIDDVHAYEVATA